MPSVIYVVMSNISEENESEAVNTIHAFSSRMEAHEYRDNLEDKENRKEAAYSEIMDFDDSDAETRADILKKFNLDESDMVTMYFGDITYYIETVTFN